MLATKFHTHTEQRAIWPRVYIHIFATEPRKEVSFTWITSQIHAARRFMSVSYQLVTARSNETIWFIKNKANFSDNWRTIQFLRTPLNAVGWLCTVELGKVTQWHLPNSFKSSSHLSHLDIVGLWDRLGSETWQSWEIIPVLTRMNGIISRMSGNSDAKISIYAHVSSTEGMSVCRDQMQNNDI